MITSTDSLLKDHRWFLDDIDFTRRELIFAHAGEDEISRQAFLDSRWQHEDAGIARVAAETIVDAMPPTQIPALHFIWHTSFCCSTLVARALDRHSHSLSLREPRVLTALADALRNSALANGQLPPRTAEAVFALLARRPAPQCRITVKPSNFANILVQGAAKRTSGKMLFLYSDLPSFLVSIVKGGVQQSRYVRRLFGDIAMDLGQPLPWSGADLLRMSDLEIAALTWHRQIAEFRRSWPMLGSERAASLDCEAFLDDPAGVLAAIDAYFGLELGAAHIQSVVDCGMLERHAKQADQAYSAQLRRQEDEAIRRQLGSTLDKVVAWSYRNCPETPEGPPLSNPLVPRLCAVF